MQKKELISRILVSKEKQAQEINTKEEIKDKNMNEDQRKKESRQSVAREEDFTCNSGCLLVINEKVTIQSE